MNVTCGSCQTVFRVDPDKVPAAGVRARCSVCSGVFWVRREAVAPEPAPPPPPIASPPVAPAPAAATAVPAPVIEPPVRPAAPPPFRMPTPASAPPPSRTIAPETPPAPPFRAGPAVSPTASPPPTAAPPPPTGRAPAPAAPPSASSPQPPVRRSPGRPTNPFLSQDPKARARRLARALVSDIVVYHPAKRRDGLRDGSLKLLFEEEIRKSWEEYVDQVGRELADSTTFFTDALNDILADGQPVFP